MSARRLCVDRERLSRRFVTILALGILAAFAGALEARGDVLPITKVRFVEHSPAAFEAAQKEGKPLFLLISAVWCYWCKYFEQQVLADAEVSKYLNQHYVSVFADYDRRPDLVRKYVRGLPMIVLFAPDGRVRQSFAGVLKKDDFLSTVKQVAATPGPSIEPGPGPIAAPTPAPLSPATYQRLREGMLTFVAENLDTVYGGFSSGDKYPHPRLLAYLLELHKATGDRRYLVAVEKTLDGVLGALYDPVDGGFFRFAEGREWRRPHYEKLVHLNATLAAVLAEAHRVTGNARYREAADRTTAYLLRTLYDANAGGFYSSQTANPAYYRLPPRERRSAAPPAVNLEKLTAWNAEAALALLALGQSSGRKDLRDVALRTLDFIRLNAVSDKGAFHLYEPRTGRRHGEGQLDANAWAALALLEGYRVGRVESYRQTGFQVLRFAVADLFDARRGAFGDDKSLPLSLDANGVMADALLQAHQVGGPADYLDLARRVLTSFGGTANTLLRDSDDAATRAPDTVYYLRAYARVFSTSQDGEPRR